MLNWLERPEVGVLNRNIAGSVELASYGNGPPGYIGPRLGPRLHRPQAI